MKFKIIEIHPPKSKENEERMYEALAGLCEHVYEKYIKDNDNK